MLTPKRNLLRILSYTLLVSVLFIGFSGCKRQQPVVEDTPKEPSAKQIQMDKARAALKALLDQDYTSLSQVEDAERELADIKKNGNW